MRSIISVSDIAKTLLILVLVLAFKVPISVAIEADVEDAALKDNWETIIVILKDDSKRKNDPIIRFILGHACLATKRYDKAKLWFDSVKDIDDFILWSEWNKSLLSRHPYNPIAIYLSADAMLRTNRIDKAIEGYKLAICYIRFNFTTINKPKIPLFHFGPIRYFVETCKSISFILLQ